jgi:hypothetical protein
MLSVAMVSPWATTGLFRAADRRCRRCRKQPAELRFRQSLYGRQVLHTHSASDRAGNAGALAQNLGRLVQGRSGAGQEVSREAQLDERELWNQYEASALDKAKAAGNEIIPVADKKPFQDAVKPVWDKYGPRFAEMVKRIQAVQ